MKGYSFRKLIDAKCKDCIYDPLSGLGTWRQQTEACTIKSCSLWPVRPVPSQTVDISAIPEEREQA